MRRPNGSGWLKTAFGGLVVAGASLAVIQGASAADMNVVVVDGGAKQTFPVSVTPRMSGLDAIEKALPMAKGGAFSLSYYPEFAGYIVTSIGKPPQAGANDYWSTCLKPSAQGSNEIMLPLALNRILVSEGDTLSLVHNASCDSGAPSH